MLDVLDKLVIDWTDLDTATQVTDGLVHELADDKETLRFLVENVTSDPDLLGKCERHRLLDKLVIYDALDRGFRIRLHLSTNDHLDRPHDHRFSFSSLILRGAYQHVRHKPIGKLDETIPGTIQEDRQAVLTDVKVEPYFTTIEEPGSYYTLHHTAIHTTITTDNTVSLFIRGPVEKERSFIMDRHTGKLWWRYGEANENPERRRRKAMPLGHYNELKAKLRGLGVI